MTVRAGVGGGAGTRVLDGLTAGIAAGIDDGAAGGGLDARHRGQWL